MFLVCLICRCTKRAPYPPPFQKVRRESKDMELDAELTSNSHLLAFENPYYDVIAGMCYPSSLSWVFWVGISKLLIPGSKGRKETLTELTQSHSGIMGSSDKFLS